MTIATDRRQSTPREWPVRRIRRATASSLASVAIALGGLLALELAQAPTAAAETEVELRSLRDTWQNKYRGLLRERAQLRADVEAMNKAYALAQRRNYPRGGARAELKASAVRAEEQLVEVERDIEAIYGDARAAGVPPGWLAEVEDEPIELDVPAAAEDATPPEDREGRNPLYFDDE